MDFRKIPCYIVAYNNLTHVDHMVKQMEKYNDNIIIIDNKSSYPPLLEYYKNSKHKIIILEKNIGANFYLTEEYSTFPEIFIYTDPDLLFNEKMPDNFLQILYEQTEKYQTARVGLALDLSDHHLFGTQKHCGQTIVQWETKFWTKPIMNEDGLDLYRAAVDTTLAVHNKRFPRTDLTDIRVAGDFKCKHIPWYKEHPLLLTEEELSYYTNKNISSSWIDRKTN